MSRPHRLRTGAPRLWPLQALLDESGLTRHQLARQAKASGRAIRIASEQGCTTNQAELWADRCGLHPCEIWPDWWDQLATDTELEGEAAA